MDVSKPRLTWWHAALALLLLLGLLLRLRGIHNPLLDHPGWRQGDEAAIARNFATLDFNPFHPQTDYNGPPPNYVELELQIVPFLAAALYKVFGIHEIFGRLLSIGFSLANIVLLAYFGRRLFRSPAAGLAAAATFAIYPGSVYYGRTFMPDTAMVALFSAALYATYAALDRDEWRPAALWPGALLCALAILAKPVAAIVLVPVVALFLSRCGPRALGRPVLWGFLLVAIAPYALYDAYLRSIAEWHWASGITSKHVLPALWSAFGSPQAFRQKLEAFNDAAFWLRETMLGLPGFWLMLAGIAAGTERRTRPLLAAYFVALLLYTFVVVTVERVDYYLYLWLPLGALVTGALVAKAQRLLEPQVTWTPGALATTGVLFGLIVMLGRAEVFHYYLYRHEVYRAAKALDATLAPAALVVMGHYDPSVLYYINRKGWEEDPYLWSVFDEQSAIRKGARYFISIEDRRLRRNLELCHWLQRFPLLPSRQPWPVYQTDPARAAPDAEARWQTFRKRELAGKATACPATSPKAAAATRPRRPRPAFRPPVAASPIQPRAGTR